MRTVVADKGYDSAEIRGYIWYQLKADAQIPLRKLDRRSEQTTSISRRKQKSTFDQVRYSRWALVETVHSILKRTMRGDVLARSRSGQHVELGLRAVAYNERRKAQLKDGFY